MQVVVPFWAHAAQGHISNRCAALKPADPLPINARGDRSARHRKGMEAGTAEKKIAILERGLEHHPGSEELLLALLNVVSRAHVRVFGMHGWPGPTHGVHPVMMRA